jgi:hypothetical protein
MVNVRKVMLRTFIALGCFAASFSFAQGFVNLDFESAQLPVIPAGQFGGYVQVTDALPGWQVFHGVSNSPVNNVLHNNATIGTINASIFGPNYTVRTIIEGQFMPFLQAGNPGVVGFSNRSVTIEQSGLVPAFAQSLQFKVGWYNEIGVGFDTNFSVSLNGQTLPLVSLGSTPTYATYGVDVTSFSGQVSDLRFTSFGTPSRPDNWVAVDSFVFSPVAVPEPSTWALFALGSTLFWCAVLRRKIKPDAPQYSSTR